MNDMIKFEPMEEMPNIIKVIGVGGGGSNAVTHMFTEGIQGVDFILCNTDYQALEKSPVAMKLHLGKKLLGAGNKPEVGREAAIETTEKIRELLSKDTKMLFITAGMGGGTGTGAAPVVASIARELDILTVGIVTLPFSVEGKRRQQQAMEGIAELRKHVDTLLVISNDKLRTEYGNMKLTQAFKKADDVLKTATKGIAEIITVTGYVNVDFQDVNTVMRNSGKAIMGSGYAEGEDRAMTAVMEAVNSPLLDDSDISGAKNILIYITSGTEEVSLDEVITITEHVQKETGNCSEVIWGNGEDPSLGNGINVTLIATGFEGNDSEYNIEQPKTVNIHQVFDDITKRPYDEEKTETPDVQEQQPEVEEDKIKVINKREEKPAPQYNPNSNNTNRQVHILSDEDDDDVLEGNHNANHPANHPVTDTTSGRNQQGGEGYRVYDNPFNNDDDDDIRSYIKNKGNTDVQTVVRHETKTKTDNTMTQQEQMRRQRLSSLNMNLRSLSNIERLENQPAYKRMGINLSADDENKELSSYSSNKDKGLRENNSYLHDNVD